MRLHKSYLVPYGFQTDLLFQHGVTRFIIVIMQIFIGTREILLWILHFCNSIKRFVINSFHIYMLHLFYIRT